MHGAYNSVYSVLNQEWILWKEKGIEMQSEMVNPNTVRTVVYLRLPSQQLYHWPGLVLSVAIS